MKSISSRPPARAGWTFALGLSATTVLAAGPEPSPDPAAAAAPVPALEYQGVLSGAPGRYLRETDAPSLPWRRLFKPDGSFEPEPHHDAGMVMPAKSMAAEKAPAAPATGASDARGIVKSVDPATGKVKLKHGPIPRLEMPGMTMVFRVKDPRLLEQVKKGDEVGFTLEVENNVFYVTGFQR